jgi:ATP-dependent DNA helicase RecG
MIYPSMTAEELLLLKENAEIEFKKAGGKNGDGEIPKDFWPTYSAMANSYGGSVFLGVDEKSGRATGIGDTDRLRKELFDLLNNKQKTSVNLLKDKDVQVVSIDGKNIIKIDIPRASREQKPVYVGENPLVGTYKREFEGDYRCDEECVRRMLAERVEPSRDDKMLEGYGFDDIDVESFKAYRNLFATNKPTHPYNECDMYEFLRSIGGWRKDRQTGKDGLTLAGLLMFGKLRSIQEVLPHYMVDYQERPEAKTEMRWVDRITIDGTWSGNLFDFYRKVIRKLYENIKVPFVLDKDTRQDESQIHIALREALVNTIAHADYSGRVSLLVVKRPDMFGFRNPGLMRIPIEQALAGGESDCRNRIIHQMFFHVGFGERAGSGVPKIFSGWSSQHWSKPILREKASPDQTLLELRMINLFDQKVINELGDIFGEDFYSLDETKRIILATASIEKTINHSRVCEIVDEHSHDVSVILRQLVDKGFLKSSGNGRGKTYALSNSALLEVDEFGFGGSGVSGSSLGYKPNGHGLQRDFGGSGVSDGGSGVRHIFDLSEVTQIEIDRLIKIAYPVSQKSRINPDITKATILALCQDYYMSLPVLAKLLNREEDRLRKDFLVPMITNGSIIRAHPNTPNHPKQAYKSMRL